MSRRKILTVMGTRPEAIKLAPVIRELRRRPDLFECQICVTGQHREMLDQVMELFMLESDFDMNIMGRNQSLGEITVRALGGLESIIRQSAPDLILVQGDTTTSLCGALAGFYQRRRVGHVEAGLRTRNKFAPYPEEINRRLVAPLTDYHFAPTTEARENLEQEGVSPSNIFVTGNTGVDALLWVRDIVQSRPPPLPEGLTNWLDCRDLILVTGHRRESFGDGFESVCRAIRDVADSYPRAVFVYPMHMNPNVREPVNRILSGHERIHLIEPLSYAPFVWVMNRAAIVLTDSGGVQEEAPSLGKPVLVMRETTERPEGIKAGNARLVGVCRERIVSELGRLLENQEAREAMSRVRNPYGDGQASKRIANILAATVF